MHYKLGSQRALLQLGLYKLAELTPEQLDELMNDPVARREYLAAQAAAQPRPGPPAVTSPHTWKLRPTTHVEVTSPHSAQSALLTDNLRRSIAYRPAISRSDILRSRAEAASATPPPPPPTAAPKDFAALRARLANRRMITRDTLLNGSRTPGFREGLRGLFSGPGGTRNLLLAAGTMLGAGALGYGLHGDRRRDE